MNELHLVTNQILLILMIFIVVFIYSAISGDMITTTLSLFIFLILLIPFFYLSEKLSLLLSSSNDLENLMFYEMIFSYSKLINIFIGIFLFVQLIYLSLSA